jgi:hypothetical protein
MNIQTSKIIEYLRNQPVKRAWLFGSYSEGTATESSDIDILVELDHSQPIGLYFVQMVLDLENILNKKVDLLTEKGISPFVKPYIDKQKTMIYKR